MDNGVHIPHQRDSSGAVPMSLVPGLRALTREAVMQIVTGIQLRVDAYAGPITGHLHQFIHAAVAAAVAYYVDSMAGVHVDRTRLVHAFQRLGEAEAIERADLTSMEQAWRVATATARELIQRHLGGIASSAAQQAESNLHAFMTHLFNQVEVGFQRPRWCHDPRARLLTDLALTPATHHEPAGWPALAERACWPLPERVVVGIAEPLTAGDPSILQVPSGLQDWLLSRTTHGWLVFVADADRLQCRREELLRALGPAVVALSWPDSPELAHHGYRIAKRALRLRRAGVLGPDLAIDCTEHVEELLLASEPGVREHLLAELAPLAELRASERLRLAETLKAMLAMPGTAAELAARLGVHPNTVRNHRARLEDLFGHRLHEPEARVRLLLAVRATLPRWRQDRRPRRRS